ncbi:MAG TPA: MBL fold metallo-hydrolase [Deltaproteobacteria bacterium]|nr:MBL fold metallo-hydrolase [Deltaproteobacteria bacterium]
MRLLCLGILLLGLGWTAAAGEASTWYPLSDHYDGRRFHNDRPVPTFMDHLRWLAAMETVPWPAWIDDPVQQKPVPIVGKGSLRVTYVNHATVLIQMDGLNVLTDPVWSERAGPFGLTGAKRVRMPGVSLDDLPVIHLVLISHDHYDHLDLPTLEKIVRRDNPVVLAGLRVKDCMPQAASGRVVDMDWWQTYRHDASGVRFTFVPAFHSSGRGFFDTDRTLWGGFVVEGARHRVYFAGDTAWGGFLEAIARRFPEFSLTIFPVGSYEKRWFMKNQHMNPEDAVRAHVLLRSRQSMGMHYATFAEHPEQAIDAHEKDLAAAVARHKIALSSFWLLGFGEGRDVGE